MNYTNTSMLPSTHYSLEQQSLPEITMFSQDNTICKTCGISYMMHNSMREQLERYRYAVMPRVRGRGAYLMLAQEGAYSRGCLFPRRGLFYMKKMPH